MDDGSLWYLISALLLIIIGGWFAGTEIALASVSKIRMISYADDGNKKAKRVLYILDHFEKALTTLLIGNNIAHIACASVMTLFAEKVWGDDSVTIITFITTLVVFFFSEMIPKSFAKECSEKFAMSSSGVLIFLMKILTPISCIFTKLTSLIEKPFGIDEDFEEPTVSQEEFKEIIESIDEEDKIDEDTKDLVQNVIAFTERKIADVMTPWDKVVTLKQGTSKEKVLEIHQNNLYSRYPVVNKEGNPVGLVKIQKYLRSAANKKNFPLSSVMSKISFVSPETPLNDLLTKMSKNRVQMAIVKDGNEILGAITVEDLLEEIVGEIYDETDEEAIS